MSPFVQALVGDYPRDAGFSEKGTGRCPEGMGAVRGPEFRPGLSWLGLRAGVGSLPPSEATPRVRSTGTSVRQVSVIHGIAAAF